MKWLGESRMEKSERVSHSVVSDSLRPYGPQCARFLCLWNSPGKTDGVGSHCLLGESRIGRDLSQI